MSDDSNTLEVIEGGLSEPPCEGSDLPHNERILETMRGLPANPGTPETDADLQRPTHSPAARTLIKAAHLVDGDRNLQHGDRYECHKLVADLWSSYFGIHIKPDQVAIAMALLKIARTKTGSDNADHYTDLCGYGALAGELSSRK